MKEIIVQSLRSRIIEDIRQADNETLFVVDADENKVLILLIAKELKKEVKVVVRSE